MPMNGSARAAVFLLSLEESQALAIIQQLGDRELRELRLAVERLGPISTEAMDSVYQDFSRDFKLGVAPAAEGSAYLTELVRRVRGDEEAARLFAGGQELPALTGGDEGRGKPLASLSSVDPELLHVAIADEHPQVAAAVLAHLDAPLAAAVMTRLAATQQIDLLRRITALRAIPADAFVDAEKALVGLDLGPGREGELDGLASAVGILNEMPSSSANELLERIAEQNPDDAAKLQRAMFSFEMLKEADQRGMQQLLREVQSDVLLTALKAASDDLKAKVFSCMSTRARAMLQEELEMMAPVRLSDVEKAQQNIVELAMRLAGEGKLTIKGRGEEML